MEIITNILNRITQGFGVNGHEGVDFGHSQNEEENKVYALKHGTVIQAVDGKDMNRGSTGTESYGNFIMIRHDDGLESTYAHLLKGSVRVKIGQVVDENTQIAIMGETGNAYGRHLHLRIRQNGQLRNPLDFIQPVTQTGTVEIKNETKPSNNGTVESKNETKPSNSEASIKEGDTVIVNGIGYATSYGTGAHTRKFTNHTMKVIYVREGRAYPYACNQYNSSNGVTGWFKDVRKS